MSESAGDKTEDATPHKMDEARQRGEIAQSREMAAFVVFAGFAITIYFYAQSALRRVANLFRTYFDFNALRAETSGEFINLMTVVLKDLIVLLAPLFAAVMIFGVAAHVGQFGFLLTTEKLSPNFSRMNPLEGFKRIFSRDTVIEFFKSSLKVSILGFIMYLLVKGDVADILTIGTKSLPAIFFYFTMMISKLAFATLLFMAALGIADFAYQKWSFAERMKMTVQEVRDEMKQREGDPMVKARIRQVQRDVVRKRMMEKVPKADVVVANPTHVAVALQYQKGKMSAPIVIAKGAGLIAVKIKEVAANSGVPILERRELARYLYRNVEISHPIPEALYSAVAEVLAYVYRMKKKFREMVGA